MDERDLRLIELCLGRGHIRPADVWALVREVRRLQSELAAAHPRGLAGRLGRRARRAAQ